MRHSFRLKLALLSFGVFGVIVFAFAILAINEIRRIGLNRIDRELLALGDPHVRKSEPVDSWNQIERSLNTLSGANKGNEFLLRVLDQQGDLVYASPHWPRNLNGEAFGLQESGRRLSRATQRDRPPDRRRQPRDIVEEQPPRDRHNRDRQDRNRPQREQASQPARLDMQSIQFETVQTDRQFWRFAVMTNKDITLLLGVSLDDFRAEMRHSRMMFIYGGLLTLIFLAAAGFILAGRALRPVNVLTKTAKGITAHGLDRRIPSVNADREFADLISVINDMLERLELSFKQSTRFSADAAHELKTPLTILQGQLEHHVQCASDGTPEQQSFAELLEEVQRLIAIVRHLLLLSQADSGTLKLSPERINLTEAAQAACDDINLLAPDLHVEQDIQPDVHADVDRLMLHQIMDNMITNAVKYNGPEGYVKIILTKDAQTIRFTTSNSGPGIPLADQPHIFDRFYRACKSRNRDVDGSGLGLSLAREMARAHHGDLLLEHSDTSRTTFVFLLPICFP